MHSLLLEFRLHDTSILPDLLRELNLGDEVDARIENGREDGERILLVSAPHTPELLWSVRSNVTLFDPRAEELTGGQGR